MSLFVFMLQEQNSIVGIKTKICTIWPIIEKLADSYSLLSGQFTELLKILLIPNLRIPQWISIDLRMKFKLSYEAYRALDNINKCCLPSQPPFPPPLSTSL